MLLPFVSAMILRALDSPLNAVLKKEMPGQARAFVSRIGSHRVEPTVGGYPLPPPPPCPPRPPRRRRRRRLLFAPAAPPPGRGPEPAVCPTGTGAPSTRL